MKNKQRKPFYQFAQETESGAAELYIFGDIVDEQYFDEETSPASLKKQLDGLLADKLDIYIDSYGGSVAAGWTLYNILRETARKNGVLISTHGVGFVASAALYPFMAGSVRVAHTPSAYFLHNVSALAAGYADDLRKTADEIDKMTEIGLGAFTENTNLSADDVKAMMKAETWLSPQEAFEKGIATAILTEAPTASASQSAKNLIFQRIFQQPQPPVIREPLHISTPAQTTPLSILQRLANMYQS